MQGTVVRRLAMTALTGLGLAAVGCGTPAVSPTLSMHAPGPTPTASAAAGPCAAVTTTTPIADVSPACAALWQPYGVTKVPPPNELQLEHVPAAPKVVNMTNGAVSDGDAQHWADASNWDSGWWKWAEGNDQPFMLIHLVGPALISAAESGPLEAGASISQPDCNLYPTSTSLFVVGSDGRAYLARKHLPTDDPYVFVVVYAGPCSETINYPDGHASNVVDFTHPTTVFTPGAIRHDPLLGDLWYGDAGGNCQDVYGPPALWCGR